MPRAGPTSSTSRRSSPWFPACPRTPRRARPARVSAAPATPGPAATPPNNEHRQTQRPASSVSQTVARRVGGSKPGLRATLVALSNLRQRSAAHAPAEPRWPSPLSGSLGAFRARLEATGSGIRASLTRPAPDAPFGSPGSLLPLPSSLPAFCPPRPAPPPARSFSVCLLLLLSSLSLHLPSLLTFLPPSFRTPT